MVSMGLDTHTMMASGEYFRTGERKSSIQGYTFFAQSVAAATDYAESHGGGGVSCDSNWGRKEDEEEIL